MRILVVEDEKALNKALVTILNKSGFSADGVFNGQEGLDYLNDSIYDGVVLDVMMPVMDGITMLKKLRQRHNNVPVLILSAKSEIDDKVDGLDMGANDYLTKPFSSKELLARIRAMTRKGDSQQDSDLHLGNLTLSRSTMKMSCPAGSYQLPNKEFQIMEMLLSNSGHVIPIERIIEKIWGYDCDVESGTVFVYISTLRKKLASLNSDVQITVIRNAGYMAEVKNA